VNRECAWANQDTARASYGFGRATASGALLPRARCGLRHIAASSTLWP
jgi:hypothetical protein